MNWILLSQESIKCTLFLNLYIVTYNVGLNVIYYGLKIHCAPAILSPMFLVLVSSYIVCPAMFSMILGTTIPISSPEL